MLCTEKQDRCSKGWPTFIVAALGSAVFVGNAFAQSDAPTDIPPAGGLPSPGNHEQDADVLSGTLSAFGLPDGNDWAAGNGFPGLIDANRNPIGSVNAIGVLDPNWGSAANEDTGVGSDGTKFQGTSNKNDDLIGAAESPWTWGNGSGGPKKNDLTNVYLYSAMDDAGFLWLIFGAETRSTNGDSHVDLEYNVAGIAICADPDGMDCGEAPGEFPVGVDSGFLVGLGPDGGRTDGDFIMSMDFEQGGGQPVLSLRVWDGTALTFGDPVTPPPDSVFLRTNEQDVSGGSWGHFNSNGSDSSVIQALQLVEGAVNLTLLGAEPADLCAAGATVLFKTRSSQSFTAELKDHALVPFPLAPTAVLLAEDDEVCEGNFAQLSAALLEEGTPPYRVEWYDPAGNLILVCDPVDDVADCPLPFDPAELDDDGDYTVIVIDSHGCVSAPVFATLIVDPNPVLAATPDEVCEFDDAQLIASANGGTSPYTIEWLGTGVSCSGLLDGEPCVLDFPGATQGQAGLYTAIATDDNDCVDEIDALLTVNENPSIEVFGEKICASEGTGQVCAMVTGGTAPYDVTWFDADGNQVHFCEGVPEGGQCCMDVDDEDVYSAVAVDSADPDGCMSDEVFGMINIHPNPLVKVIADQVCEGFSGDLCAVLGGGTAPYNVVWRDADGNFVGSCNDVPENGKCCIEVGDGGVYTAFVTDSAACEVEGSGALDINPNPIVTTGDDQVCEFDDGQLTASATNGTPPYTIEWLGTGVSCSGLLDGEPCVLDFPGATQGQAGLYNAIATDDNDCVDELTAELIVDENPMVAITPPALPLCGSTGNTMTAVSSEGTPPYTFEWLLVSEPGGWVITSGSTSDTITYTAGVPGIATFKVDVLDANLCPTDTMIQVECAVGDEGCTPGYWKQVVPPNDQHLDEWMLTPYLPDDLFANTDSNGDGTGEFFDNAFDGKTLLVVLAQPASARPGPNSLNNLGRHTVAALLNAAHPNVHYALTPDEVISMFNDVYPGSDSDYQELQGVFADLNEQGCPLNGNADANGDGQVGILDLLIVLSNWGTPGPGDVNNDGIVDSADLLIVFTWWGS